MTTFDIYPPGDSYQNYFNNGKALVACLCLASTLQLQVYNSIGHRLPPKTVVNILEWLISKYMLNSRASGALGFRCL